MNTPAPRVVSINIGRIQAVPWRGRVVRTAIRKEPIGLRPVMVGRAGMIGDDLLKLRLHRFPRTRSEVLLTTGYLASAVLLEGDDEVLVGSSPQGELPYDYRVLGALALDPVGVAVLRQLLAENLRC